MTQKGKRKMSTVVEPSLIFVVPYRSRPEHRQFFVNYLNIILQDRDRSTYEVMFSHQTDIRTFNRGATKNIGFLAIKAKYPNTYKSKTIVFNDIDTMPFANILPYETESGIVKHFYGFDFALGGIVSITGGDFEKTNGFPNYFGWGSEDLVLQNRCLKAGLKIDRSHFYKIGSPSILQLFDGISRIINARDPWRAKHDKGIDGIRTIYRLAYTISHYEESRWPNYYMVDIATFMSTIRFESESYSRYDLREPARKIINPRFLSAPTPRVITDDWSNIPYYPTAATRQEIVKQHGEEKTNRFINQSLNAAYFQKK